MLIKQVPAEGTVLAFFKYANKDSTVYAFQISKYSEYCDIDNYEK